MEEKSVKEYLEEMQAVKMAEAKAKELKIIAEIVASKQAQIISYMSYTSFKVFNQEPIIDNKSIAKAIFGSPYQHDFQSVGKAKGELTAWREALEEKYNIKIYVIVNDGYYGDEVCFLLGKDSKLDPAPINQLF